jgi:hypothetical protein
MRRIALAVALLIASVAAALAQAPVTVIGPITPGDCAQFSSTTIIKDGGGCIISGGAAGGVLSGTYPNPAFSASVQSALTGTNTGLLFGTGAFGFAATAAPATAGTIAYWNGAAWVLLAGNTSGTQVLSENNFGVPSWSPAGAATVTSVTCNGVTITVSGTCPSPFFPTNCTLAASVASNILTVALKDNTGADPTATSPCYIPFRSATANTGSTTFDTVTSALSITTNAVGASLGSSNNTAFRFWVEAFDNGGTVVLSLFNAVSVGTNSTQCFPLYPATVATTVAISGSATSAGTFYTPNGTTLTSKAHTTIGYIEYNSTGLATAGTYATAPNFIQTFGPGIRKPCEPVQSAYFPQPGNVTSATATTYTTVTWPATPTIAPNSAANIVKVTWNAYVNASAGNALFLRILRAGTTAIGVATAAGARTQAGAAIVRTSDAVSLQNMGQTIYDFPNSTASTTYALQFFLQGGTFELNQTDADTNDNVHPRTLSHVTLEEIMGALPQIIPDNDNDPRLLNNVG